MAKIRIMLADDHTLFRQGIRTLISAEPDMEVVGEASNGGDAVEKANEARPDVVLMDIGMPGLSQLRSHPPDQEEPARNQGPVPDHVRRRRLSCRRHGSRRQRLRPEGQPQPAVGGGRPRRVPRRQLSFSPRMLSQLVDDFRSRIKSANRLPRFATLTTREREVLKMLAEGNSVKEIACDLNLSVKTVEAHKFNLMRKLDIHNKAQLVQYAIQKKIIKIPNLV